MNNFKRYFYKKYDLFFQFCNCSGVDYQLYNELNNAHFWVSITEISGEWKVMDVKELRENIDGL